MKPRQLAFEFAGPASAPSPAPARDELPPMELYLETLEAARENRNDPEGVSQYLADRLAAGAIVATDAIAIWRYLYSRWETPFDRA